MANKRSRDADVTQGRHKSDTKNKSKRVSDSPNGESCTETPKTAPTEPSAANGEAVLEFPCVGKAKTWHLTQSKIDEYAESFPHLDVLAECRKARQWARDNPKKRKTAKGMPAFLTSWLGRAQNSTQGRAPPVGGGSTRSGRAGHGQVHDPNQKLDKGDF